MQLWPKLWVWHLKQTQRRSPVLLARLRINHSPLMGQSEINGKSVNVEVVEGGTYKAEDTGW